MKYHSAVYTIILIVKLFVYPDKWSKLRLLSEPGNDLHLSTMTCLLFVYKQLNYVLIPASNKSGKEFSEVPWDKDDILMGEAEEAEGF